jgi:HlyD family secretion protein
LANHWRLRRLSVLLLCLGLVACGLDNTELALGTLERDRLELVADAAEPIVELPVTEGAEVSVGEVIWRQHTALREAEIQGLKATLGRAQAQLAELEHGPRSEDIAEARQRLLGARGVAQEAGLQVERFARLVKEKQASQARLDSATAQLAAARAEVGVAS